MPVLEGGVVMAWAAARIGVEIEEGEGAEVLECGVEVAWATPHVGELMSASEGDRERREVCYGSYSSGSGGRIV